MAHFCAYMGKARDERARTWIPSTALEKHMKLFECFFSTILFPHILAHQQVGSCLMLKQCPSEHLHWDQPVLGICHWLLLFILQQKYLLPIPRENILHATFVLKTWLSDQSVLWTRPKSHRCHYPHTDRAISELSSHGFESMLPERPTLVWWSSWQHRNSSRYHFLFLTMHRVKAEHFSLASILRKEVGNDDENFPSNSAGNNLSS